MREYKSGNLIEKTTVYSARSSQYLHIRVQVMRVLEMLNDHLDIMIITLIYPQILRKYWRAAPKDKIVRERARQNKSLEVLFEVAEKPCLEHVEAMLHLTLHG